MDRRGASHGEHPSRLDQHRQRCPAPRRPPVFSLTWHPLTIGVGLLLAAILVPTIHSATTRPLTHAATPWPGTSAVPLEIAPLFEDVRGGQLLESFGCAEVDVIFYGSCLDDDATLTSLEAWEAFRDPDDAVGSAAFIAEWCSSVPESAALRHYLVARDGSWRLSGDSDLIAKNAIAAGGVDVKDRTSRTQLCR